MRPTGHSRTFSARRRRRAGWLSRVMSVLTGLFLLFAQSPAADAMEEVVWVEICGAHGSYLAPVSTGEDNSLSGCRHCAYCTLSATYSTLEPHPQALALPVSFPEAFVFFEENRAVSDMPDQFWSQSRGPPPEQIDIDLQRFILRYVR